MGDAEERTQAPSEKRLLRAREDGQAPLSRELVSLAGLAAAALGLMLGMPAVTTRLGQHLQRLLTIPASVPSEALLQAASAWSSGAVTLLVGVAAAGTVAVLLQTRFLIHGSALKPDPARLNPARGLKRVLGRSNLVEAVKALVKASVLGWAVWRALAAVWPEMASAVAWTPEHLLSQIGRDLIHLLLLVVAGQAGIALLDVSWIRWRFHQRLRMSREDLKDEVKEAEGDPRVKGRLRQLRMARAKRRMVAAVAKATVVVTNPTHYAVALSYERGTQSAPRIVAKGVDEVAARIRAAAEASRVPLVANAPLARALYLVPLDAEIPPEHFKLVAEIIAYVWRLRQPACHPP